MEKATRFAANPTRNKIKALFEEFINIFISKISTWSDTCLDAYCSTPLITSPKKLKTVICYARVRSDVAPFDCQAWGNTLISLSYSVWICQYTITAPCLSTVLLFSASAVLWLCPEKIANFSSNWFFFVHRPSSTLNIIVNCSDHNLSTILQWPGGCFTSSLANRSAARKNSMDVVPLCICVLVKAEKYSRSGLPVEKKYRDQTRN